MNILKRKISMRIITTIVFVTLMVQTSFSQDIKKCREIVEITIASINTKSVTELETHLADDFEMANQTGEIAKMVLKQLITQLNETVLSQNEKSSENKQSNLILIYTIEYKGMGKRDATFIFDKENKLKSLELFEMEVKTMNNTDRVIEKNTTNVISVPFSLAGNLIVVDVIVNGSKQKFLLDSGSPLVVMNSVHLSENNEKTKKISSLMQGATGSINSMDIAKIDKLEFAGIEIRNQEIITLDLSHLENELETKIYGLIGYEILKDYDLLFDYKNKELTLINPDYFDQYKKKELLNSKLSIIPLELSSHIPVFKAKIGNTEYSFGIDCGAETNLMDDKLLPAMTKFLKHTEKDILLGADKNSTDVTIGLIKTIYIGKNKYKNVATVFNDMSQLNNGYKLKLDGLMGYELLSKQKTIISYKRKEMILIE